MKRYKDIVGDGGSNIVGQVDEQHALLKARMATIRHKIAVVSGKGGVGKSSITANLAAVFAAQGRLMWSMGHMYLVPILLVVARMLDREERTARQREAIRGDQPGR